MPKENTKTQKSNELDETELFAAISLIEEEKGIPKAYMLGKITQVPVFTYKRDRESARDNVTMETDEEANTIRMFVKKNMVEEIDNPYTEMGFQITRGKLPHTQLGNVIRIRVYIRGFGRIAAQTVCQVIIQGMREVEQGIVYNEFSSKEHKILTGVVTRVNSRSGTVSLRIGSGSEATEAFLTSGEQVEGETYLEGMRLCIYVVEVHRSTKGPRVLISRTHPDLVKRPFELEVPEIYDSIVEVKSITRRAGSRTKLAIWSTDPNMDPIGTCVGPRDQRVSNIVGELKGEKVDTIKRSEEPAEYIAAVLSPTGAVSIAVREKSKACRAMVPDDQLFLTTGEEGQSAQLATKLTGWRIGIKPASAPANEKPEDEAGVLLDDEAEIKE